MLAKSITVLWALFLLVSTVQAQFQFFEQMFGGGGQGGHHGEQEASSDSSWYQRTWEGGMFFNPSILPKVFLTNYIHYFLQPTARDTSVLAHYPASISHTIVRARILMLKKKSSLVKEARFAHPEVVSRPGKLQGRSNWRAKAFCKYANPWFFYG
jgi:hypothetical protein